MQHMGLHWRANALMLSALQVEALAGEVMMKLATHPALLLPRLT